MIFQIEDIKPLLMLVVRAVEKGIGEDIRDYLQSTEKATNNAVRLMRADNINTNLRDSVASDTVELKYFKRSAWMGCLIIDRVHKVTITICAKQTLEGIPRKHDRRMPHYLQSILYIQNSDAEPRYVQQTLDDFSEVGRQFSDEEYREDYKNIMEDELEFGDGYKHLVVVYEAAHNEVTTIAVKMLTPEFQTTQEYSLDNLLKPDFSELTNTAPTVEQIKDARSLVSVKVNLRNEKEPMNVQETKITARKMEVEKQA